MIEVLPLRYQPSLAASVAKLRHLPWLIALDSGFTESSSDNPRSSSDKPLSSRGLTAGSSDKPRYDILTADPILRLTADDQYCYVFSKNGCQKSLEDPFSFLDSLRQQYVLPNHDSPFAGGFMGYFAYDLAYRMLGMQRQHTPDIELPLLAIGLYDWAIVTDHQQQTTSVYWIPSWTEDPQQRQQKLQEYWAKLAEATPGAQDSTSGFKLTSDFSTNMTKAEYTAALAIIKQHLQAGNVYQVNFAQRFSAAYSGDPYYLYHRLAASNALGPFSAYLQFGESRIVSISPERFLSLADDGTVLTHPIKGTIARGVTAADDAWQKQLLLASEKDQAENLMIVDLMRNDLGKCCEPGSIKVTKLFALESFKTVHHLVSRIRGKLAAKATPISLLAATFPGGSITGAPKLSAMQIINELEPNQRHLYCGSIGYIDASGKMDLNIAIRTLVADAGKLHFWGGGGIVFDSDAEAEYQECLDKVGSFIELFV